MSSHLRPIIGLKIEAGEEDEDSHFFDEESSDPNNEPLNFHSPPTKPPAISLHSIGQMIQDGKRNIIETIIDVKEPTYEMTICPMEDNLDGLDFLLGKNVSHANSCALKATALAHRDGGVPVSILEVEKLDEFNYGYLVYLFEYTCGVSAYMLGVNPFNQPGVEEYKKNMFRLLEKPGY